MDEDPVMKACSLLLKELEEKQDENEESKDQALASSEAPKVPCIQISDLLFNNMV